MDGKDKRFLGVRESIVVKRRNYILERYLVIMDIFRAIKWNDYEKLDDNTTWNFYDVLFVFFNKERGFGKHK